MVVGEGVDPTFDTMLSLLGCVAAHRPRPVIDSVMFWRKSKGETPPIMPPPPPAAAAAGAVAQSPCTPPATRQHRATANGLSSPRVRYSVDSQSGSPGQGAGVRNLDYESRDARITVERRSAASIFILCRTLIEVFKHTSKEALGEDMGDKLEEIIFNQLQNADMETLEHNPMRMANWKLFAQVLGYLSTLRFVSVSDRFIAEIEKSIKSGVMFKEREIKTELVIHGLKHIKIKIYPIEALEESSDFLNSLTRFFLQSHGQRIKVAYLLGFHHLILPVACRANAEANLPAWSQMVQCLYPRVCAMMNKQKYWNLASQLCATLLCVSSREFFLTNLNAYLEIVLLKLRDKTARVNTILHVVRLVWIALYRHIDTTENTLKRLRLIDRHFFPVGKKPCCVDEVSTSLFVIYLRIVASKHPSFCCQTLLLPFLHAGTIAQYSGLIPLELLIVDKMAIAIRVYSSLLGGPNSERINGIPFPDMEAEYLIANSQMFMPISTINESLQTFHSQFAQLIGKIVYTCGLHYLVNNPIDDREVVSKSAISPFNIQDMSPHTANISSHKPAPLDLLTAIFECLPVAMPTNLPTWKVIEILCHASVYQDKTIAATAGNALRAIASIPTYARQTVTVYTRVMFKLDDKSSNMNVERWIMTPQAEQSLLLNVELFEAWVTSLETSVGQPEGTYNSKSALAALESDNDNKRGEEMEMTSIWTVIEEIEAHALFFLCSHARLLRRHALRLLQLVAEFDVVFEESQNVQNFKNFARRTRERTRTPRGLRIYDLFDDQPTTMSQIPLDIDELTVAERSRFQKLQNTRSKDMLTRLATSDNMIDDSLWYKIFPHFVRLCFARYPTTVVLCRNTVCIRLLQMHNIIVSISDRSTPGTSGNNTSDYFLKQSSVYSSTIVGSQTQQWGLYLVIACTTLTLTDEQTPKIQLVQHGRKGSVPVASFDRITSARTVFQLVVPLLASDYEPIRQVIIFALGCININLYKALLEAFQPILKILGEETRQKLNQKTSSLNRKNNSFRAGICHVLYLTSNFVKHEDVREDEWVFDILVGFIKDTKLFLSDTSVQVLWEFLSLRRYYCCLVETIYDGIVKTSDPQRWLPLEGRVSLFRLIEEWCGFGPQSTIAKDREKRMKGSIMDQFRDAKDRGTLTAKLEIERKRVELAALNAMASLCIGPVMQTIDKGGTKQALMSFDVVGLFRWIDALFGAQSERIHRVGRRALYNLLITNVDQFILFDDAIQQCYVMDPELKGTQSYFGVIARVVTENPETRCQAHKLIVLCLYQLGHQNADIRLKAWNVLRQTSMKLPEKSAIDAFESAALSNSSSARRRIQSKISAALAKQHLDLTLFVFSELSMLINTLGDGSKREIVRIILPWLATIQLELDADGKDLSGSAYMVLINLFKITVHFLDIMPREIEELWTTVASDEHAGNVKAAMDFLLCICLEQRNAQFASYARIIIGYLSKTASGQKLIDALVAYFQHASMVPVTKEPNPNIIAEASFYPYTAKVSDILPSHLKQVALSFGQLALIFSVDLVVEPSPSIFAQVPILLHVCFIQMDHFIQVVHEVAKEMLGNIILLCLRCPDSDSAVSLIRNFNDDLRGRDSKLLWQYDEMSRKSSSDARSPKRMEVMITDVMAIFDKIGKAEIRSQWSTIALHWANSCSVRHLACRSFQVFRCLKSGIDAAMLADMLARFSNTVADFSSDIRGFAMEILITLGGIIRSLDVDMLRQYPQLFWVIIATLHTTVQAEFLEALSILETLLNKLDFNSAETLVFLHDNLPAKWDGLFQGIQPLLFKGLRSSTSMEITYNILDRLSDIPIISPLIGEECRLLFDLLANIPRYLDHFDYNPFPTHVITSIDCLCVLSDLYGKRGIRRVLESFAKRRFRSKEEFIKQTVFCIKEAYFPDWDVPALIFLLGLLSNKTSWIRVKVMEILKAILPLINLQKPELSGLGADIISPLLRLLQTNYAQQALGVLDEAISISGGPMDKDILRMSLGNRNVNADVGERVTLFGVPDEDGWSIPDPIGASTRTRNCVHAVYYMCIESTAEQVLEHLPEVQFHREDHTYTFTAETERADTMLSDDRASLGDMVSTLHSLDIFFTEDQQSFGPNGSSPTDNETVTEAEDTAPVIYDNRVAAILNRSLTRNPSLTSLHDSLADSFASHPNIY